MKDVSKMNEDLRAFYDYVSEYVNNCFPCEIENFKAVYGDIDYLDWLFDLYSSITNYYEVLTMKFDEGCEDGFWSLLEMERITLKDGVEEDEALSEYLKGTQGNFLEMINEKVW